MGAASPDPDLDAEIAPMSAPAAAAAAGEAVRIGDIGGGSIGPIRVGEWADVPAANSMGRGLVLLLVLVLLVLLLGWMSLLRPIGVVMEEEVVEEEDNDEGEDESPLVTSPKPAGSSSCTAAVLGRSSAVDGTKLSRALPLA